jgi:uncharacterized OB-fold protein
MGAGPTKNLPASTPETAEYWAGCRRHELLIQCCASCGAHQFYPRILCTSCSGRSLQWVRACGRGTIASFTVVRRAVSEAYAAEVPYVVALIRLEEGPTLMSNVVGCAVEAVTMGMPVEVVFEDWPGDVSVPKFRPASLTSSPRS